MLRLTEAAGTSAAAVDALSTMTLPGRPIPPRATKPQPFIGYGAGMDIAALSHSFGLIVAVAALSAAAAVAGGVAMIANRRLRRRNDTLERRLEELADQEWGWREADAANRAKNRFLAMVSHEIRTPLNGVLGMADLLLATPLTAEQTTYAEAVRSSGGTLLSLIEDMLDFSKIEAGRLDLDPQPFALSALIEETVELLAPRAHAKGIEIACLVDDALPRRLVGDTARLRQIVLNLAGNAIKFTETGGVLVGIEPASTRAGAIALWVRDTGIGIAAADRARIFEEFEQAEGGLNRRFGGTGLGLAITRRLVEAMGGMIEVRSNPGHGSEFLCTIPLPAAPDLDGVGAQLPRPPALAGVAVLIAAPGVIEAPQLARCLTAWGARVEVATTLPAARQSVAAGPWDAVIIDAAFGRAAAEEIGALIPPPVKRKLVLVTPTDRAGLSSFGAAGFTGYLVKPVRTASLARRFAGPAAGTWLSPMAAAAAAAEQRSAPPSVATPQGRAAPAGLAILIAEDNDINALLAGNLLKRLGHRPVIVANGTDAVAAVEAAYAGSMPFDLILMDLHMPGIDGVEAARRIRAAETRAGRRRVPIIALTADTVAENQDACNAAGMDGFLVKPLDREKLIPALQDRAGAERAA